MESIASQRPIRRATLITVNNPDDIDAMLEKAATLQQEAKKDSKSYLKSVSVGRVMDDPRNKGYNFALFVTFSSLEDMRYYDEEDAAHGALKASMKGKVAGPPMVVYFEDVV